MEEFAILSLAIWRLSSLFAREDGPFDILLRLRLLIGTEFDVHGDEIGTNWFSKGILCCWCNSVWFSIILAPIISISFVDWFVNLLALSAITIFIEEKVV